MATGQLVPKVFTFWGGRNGNMTLIFAESAAHSYDVFMKQEEYLAGYQA